MDRPHYLRVVQALVLVSGFGPVAIATSGCSNGTPSPPTCTGTCGPPEYIDASPADADAAVDAPADVVTGLYDGTVLGVGLAPEDDAGVK